MSDPETKCKKIELARKYCPLTCGLCLSQTSSPTLSPTFSSMGCRDDDDFRFKNQNRKTCDWVKENNPMIKCNEKRIFKKYCPETCGLCPKECMDDTNFRYNNNKLKSCNWLKENQPDKNCNEIEALRKSCPKTCGLCRKNCKDDPNFRYKNDMRMTCNWVKRNDLLRKCNNIKIIKNSCPMTCGLCWKNTQKPTVAPTNTPSYYPSTHPSFYPSLSPTVTPTNTPSNFPSATPSAFPSTLPSSYPSIRPTVTPTDMPSNSPSDVPTNIPSAFPSTLPSSYPSIRPTVSIPSTKECMTKVLPTGDEALSSRKWWENESGFRFSKRFKWFLKRMPNQPIVGRTTVIVGVMFSFTQKTVKLSVFFPPLYNTEYKKATVLLKGEDSGFVRTQECDIVKDIWHCNVRFDYVSDSESYSYRVRYCPIPENMNLTYIYTGLIPKPQGFPRIAALGCFGVESQTNKTILVDAVMSTSPDLIILSGDQTYQHSMLIIGFLQTLLSIGELTRSLPTIVQMDDHDYGQSNLFGAGGGDERSGGGFEKLPCFTSILEDFMMGHNPDPARNKMLHNGMKPKFTEYEYGRISFAIIEGRKFKHESSNIDNKSLLGNDQELWLKEWCAQKNNKLHVVLSVTPFAGLATHIKSNGETSFKETSSKNNDSNGFPVKGRKRAMEILHECSPLIISGDQHLGIVVSYDDYNITECASPAVHNSMYWRMNTNNLNSKHFDHFGNEYFLHNVWNVRRSVSVKDPISTRKGSKYIKNARGDGFMTVQFDGKNAQCAMHEYWLEHNLKWKVDFPI